MTSVLVSVVKQIAHRIKGQTVLVELICSSELGAQELGDDIDWRLRKEGVLSLVVKVGAKVESGADT